MQSITRETIQSLVGYMNAPVLERRCISIIASRTQSADLKQYRGAFEEVDMDGDGRISHFDLRRSMQAVWRILSLSIDVDALFDAMYLHHNGMISFTDFAAACLHSELAPRRLVGRTGFQLLGSRQRRLCFSTGSRKTVWRAACRLTTCPCIRFAALAQMPPRLQPQV